VLPQPLRSLNWRLPMEQQHVPSETYMVRYWHGGPVSAQLSNLVVVHAEQPVQDVAATAVPEPATLGLMLAVGAAAITFSVIRALRVHRQDRYDRRDRTAEFGRS
jgi:hypothetical protein